MALRTEKKLQKSYFDVLGICCTSEVPLVENILKSLDGIKEYSVIVPSRTVIVVHDTLLLSQYQIVKALNQARLEANVRITGESNFKNKWPNPFTVVSGVLLLVSFVHYVFPPFRWLAVAAVVAGIYPIIAKSFASLRMFRIDINILVVITVIATLAMRDYTEAAAVVFLFTIAEWLQTRASYKASAVMQSLMSLAPQKATIAETGEEVEVDELKINTIIAVKAGEIIPIDGIVVDGNCEIDEKTLTGEPFPVPKHRDSTVWAGTINLNGYISVKTIALAEDCAVAKMAKLVEEAQNRKTNTQRFIDKCSQYYTPAIILISAGFAIIPLALKVDNLRHWFHLALVVLVSACPCGLILSTPVATCCALSKAATSQLLIKGADYLETLAKLKIIAFDKTGTITRGEFIVIDFKSISQDLALETLLYWVSSAESKSSHPMAAALVDYARSMAIEPNPEVVEDYMNFPGEGISGKIDGKEIYIGNKRIALRAGCSSVPDIDVDTRGGKTVGYVYTEARLVGVFNLSDACRSGVAQAMKELKSLGLKTVMLTGDNQAAAMYAQEQLGNGLDVVKAELLPEGKSKLIEEFKKEGLTGMVGDGLNDAPALATANIGISMGVSGSALVTETGDIILMSNDIRRIPQAIELARRTQDKVIENVILSITMKGGILALAIAGHPLIWAAVLADVGTCLLVIFNSMLLLRDKNKPGNKCYRDVKKLKPEDNVVDDMEAGLLPKTLDGHCKSSCCGHKNQEKVIKLVEIRTEPGHHGHGHGHSGCCDKKHDHKVKPVSHERVIKLAETKTDSDHSHHSGCCQKKHEDKSRLVRRSCCPIPVVSRHCRNFENHLLEEKVELLPKSSAGHSRSCCCRKKSHEKVIKPAETRLVSDHSHSGCCDKKHEDKFKLERQSCGPKSVDQGVTETQLLLKSSDGHGGSGCCGKKKQEEVIKLTDTDHDHCGQEDKVRLVRQSCCPKPVDLGHSDMGCCDDKTQHIITCCEKPDGLVRSQEKMKSISDCRSGHCLEEHQPLKNLETQTQKAKTDEHCKAPCCDDNKNKEIVNEYSCDLESEGSCKSHCCSCEEEEVTETTNLISQAETEDLDCCNSGCCHNEDEEDQSSHDKPDNSDQEISRSNQSSKLYRSASTPLETLTRLL